MKKIFGIAVILSIIAGMISCTDVQGDGINTVIWEGSVVPEDSCYRNPVWEPDLSFPSVFQAAVGYYAFGVDNEWSPGLKYTAPVLSSNDLMTWRLRGEGFQDKPDWAESGITGISAGFSRTRGTYFLFYELGEAGIGMAASRAPQGPFTDFGLFINADSVNLSVCTNPYFFAFGSRAYLFFNGGDGIYGQEMDIFRDRLAVRKGNKFKITGSAVSNINIFRYNTIYYLFASVKDGINSRITIGRAFDVTGPFLDKNGNNLLDSEGTMLLSGTSDNGFVAVNHVGGVFEDAKGYVWILYQATDINMPLLSSGTDRHPLMLSRIEFDDAFWPVGTYEAKGSWNYPKFAK